jgi:acyl-CoA synthetase (AMP-forming)/AMP-acid ligase II
MTGAQVHVPQQPLFTQLFQHAQKTPKQTFIRDSGNGKEATFTEFLYEVLAHGTRLKETLSQDIQARLYNPNEEVFIGLLAGAGFEYVVLVFAIHSIGGIAVPMSMYESVVLDLWVIGSD